MNGQRHEQPISVKIPADVDQPDRILYGLTGRQLAVLAATATAVLWTWLTLHALVPFPVLAAVLVPVVACGFVAAVARRDGMGLDRYAATALTYLRTPKMLVTSSEPIQPPPSWCRMRGWLPAPLRLPVRAVRQDGAMELAEGGVAVIVRAGTVAFSLRTPDEQASLVAVFGRWLNSLESPVQILVQARPVDLSGLAQHIAGHATRLRDRRLEEAAGEHAGFLAELGTAHELLVRQILIVIGDGTGPPTGAVAPWSRGRRQRVGRDAGAAVALRRAQEAVQSLAALGVTAEVLDALACTTVLAESLSPGEQHPVDNTDPGGLITGKRQS
ncbi:PrgI family protein [Actinomadura macra]|uniref:PrgI family protein n=1 Tax=Actinomadura macra TaxID=46164 RepID=UPI0008302E62|nr:PrgI family protein [Actinomadura macra]